MLKSTLKDKSILITAGPTRESIDPVRYITNHSSGKMGYAIAQEFLKRGANVVLVSGPVCLCISHERLKIIKVHSANEMYLTCCKYFEDVDIAVFAAAVADYRPSEIAAQKIKKSDDTFNIRMIKNIDIAFEFGKIKQPHQVSVGFALETNDEEKNSISKLEKKNFDMVVLNSMADALSGFEYDTNKITIFQRDLSIMKFPLKTKLEAAVDIVDAAGKLFAASKKLNSVAY